MTDLDADHYRSNSERQYSLTHEALDSLSLNGDETVLDIGCGDGRITAEIAKCVPKGYVIGIDPSFAMIELARRSFTYPNLNFINSAAEDMSPLQPADLILIMNALHWIRNPVKAIANFASALKPTGTLLALTYPKESPYWDFLEETSKGDQWRPFIDQSAYTTLLTSLEYKKIIEESGFKIEEFALEEKVATYSSSSDLLAYVKGWLQCYLPLPSHLESQFLQEALNHARSHSLIKGSGEIQLPYSKLILKAQKVMVD